MQQFIVYTGKIRLLNKNSLRYGRDDPKGDRQTWIRFSRLMRSALVLKAPAVRSGLIINFYKVLLLRLVVRPLDLRKLLKRLGDNWRLCARQLEPFLRVYMYNNDISENFIYDK
ncbi:hypothetical protein GQ55_2G212000 [Panicum hallii var. hallii]|uniref:Uncharacterized protein n=1 Tax=Panicum hallii var. hallii TaxID=1504633 RepID=A0A2T7EQZ8_9POAL|nr:hypothetical protein GQ55_2G212000 [Panicum hallii var. hallii]